MTQAAIECSGLPNGFDAVLVSRALATRAAGAVTVLADADGAGTSTLSPIIAGSFPA